MNEAAHTLVFENWFKSRNYFDKFNAVIHVTYHKIWITGSVNTGSNFKI